MSRSAITLILAAVVIALLGAGAYFVFNDSLPQLGEEQKEWQVYNNQALGFSLEYPPEYEVEEGAGNNLVTLTPKYPSQAQLSGLRPIKISVSNLATSTFSAYTADLEANHISNLAWVNHEDEINVINQELELGAITKTEATQRLVALEQTIAEEVLSHEGKYSFKTESINGINAFFHERSFYNVAGEVYEMYADWGQQVLILSSESDHAALERVYRSLKKI